MRQVCSGGSLCTYWGVSSVGVRLVAGTSSSRHPYQFLTACPVLCYGARAALLLRMRAIGLKSSATTHVRMSAPVWAFVHSFNKYLLSPYCEPDAWCCVGAGTS